MMGMPATTSGTSIVVRLAMRVTESNEAVANEGRFDVEDAVQIIRESAGTHFDPKLVEVFLRHKTDFVK